MMEKKGIRRQHDAKKKGYEDRKCSGEECRTDRRYP